MEQSMSWVLPVVTLGIGIAAGVVIGRLSRPANTGEAREKLDEMQDRLQQYQGEVVDHFAATAGLVQRMNDSYQDVLDHLTEGADKLSPDDETRERLMATLKEGSSAPRVTKATTSDEQPRDYAPGTGGTLSPEFSAQHAKAREKELAEEEPQKKLNTEKPAEAPVEAEAPAAEEPATIQPPLDAPQAEADKPASAEEAADKEEKPKA